MYEVEEQEDQEEKQAEMRELRVVVLRFEHIGEELPEKLHFLIIF